MAYFSTRYQIDQARVEGVRYEDTFYNKFWRETFFSWHIYAQNFHPESLLERTREVTFYRKYDALFKGFSVPEWAQASKNLAIEWSQNIKDPGTYKVEVYQSGYVVGKGSVDLR